MDLVLQLGNVNESVTVSAEAAQLQTDTATMGQVIAESAVADLPLNGRNFLQLATLSAGTVPATSNTAAAARLGRPTLTAHVSGGRASENSFLLDGIEMRGSRFGEISILPAPDTIKEFKIQQNYYSAEYGTSLGIVSVFTKSGANEFHGAAYEFLRNSDLDARNFFDGAAPPLYKQNQFGAVLGGAIVKNKTFFFGGYDGQRIAQSTVQFATVPSPQLLTGNFTGLAAIKDPFNSSAPFPGNIIPGSRISKIASNFNAYIPAPNSNSPQGNYTGSPATTNNYNQFDTRVDHTFSQSDSMFVRYLQSDWSIVNLGLLPYSGSEYPLNGKNAVIQETHISPTLVNTVKLGFSRAFTEPANQTSSTDLAKQIGFLNTEVSPLDYNLPRFTIAGYTQMGHSQQTFHQWTNTYILSDTLILMKGRHNISMGGDIRENRSPQQTTNGTNGRMTMNGQFTGNALADYLLGAYQAASVMDTSGNLDVRYSNIAAFVQDDFKITPRLTLNLGVRWEYQQPWQVPGGGAGYFDPTIPGLRLAKPPSAFGLNVSAPFIVVGGVGNSVYKPDYKNFIPRFGFAYRATDKTVIRGGYGIFYVQNQGSWVVGEALNPGLAVTLNFTNSAGQTPRLLDTLFDSPAVAATSAAATFSGVPPNRQNSYIQQWNLNIQRELPGHLIAQVAYTGSVGRHLVSQQDINLAAFNLPGQNLSLAARRPYPNFGSIVYWASNGNSNYNAFTANLERRFARGFSVLSNYAYSKSIDDDSMGNTDDIVQMWPQNLRLDRSVSDYDTRHRFTTSVVWELPFGKGRPYLGSSAGLANWAVSGWQMNGILQLQSGLPFTVTEVGDLANIGFTGNERGNRLSSGILSNPTPNHWFDTSAYVLQAAGTYGNSARDTAFQDGTKNLDLSLFKNNYIFGEKRWNLQFRAEFFNFLNNVNFGRPNQSINGPAFGVVTSAATPRQIQFALKFLF